MILTTNHMQFTKQLAQMVNMIEPTIVRLNKYGSAPFLLVSILIPSNTKTITMQSAK
jgi:hypothetical protein